MTEIKEEKEPEPEPIEVPEDTDAAPIDVADLPVDPNPSFETISIPRN